MEILQHSALLLPISSHLHVQRCHTAGLDSTAAEILAPWRGANATDEGWVCLLGCCFFFFFFQKAGCETLTSTGLGSRVTCHDLVFTMGSARTPKEQHGNAEQRAANSARPRHHPCDFSQYSCEETQLERLLRVFSVPQFAYL